MDSWTWWAPTTSNSPIGRCLNGSLESPIFRTFESIQINKNREFRSKILVPLTGWPRQQVTCHRTCPKRPGSGLDVSVTRYSKKSPSATKCINISTHWSGKLENYVKSEYRSGSHKYLFRVQNISNELHKFCVRWMLLVGRFTSITVVGVQQLHHFTGKALYRRRWHNCSLHKPGTI